jgi:hypothetical protein
MEALPQSPDMSLLQPRFSGYRMKTISQLHRRREAQGKRKGKKKERGTAGMYAGIPNTATYNFTESKGRRDELRGFKLKRAVRCMEASIYENFHLWLQLVQLSRGSRMDEQRT